MACGDRHSEMVGNQGRDRDSSRELELGAGKWSEAADARSLDELRQQMDSAPVRELQVEPAGPRWELLGIVAIVLLLLVAWWVFQPFSATESTPPPPESVTARAGRAAPEQPPAPAPAPAPQSTREAASATVQVTTTPSGARIRLDDRSYGLSPATVPIPRDGQSHRLCAEAADAEPVCRDVTGATLSARDTFDIPLGAAGTEPAPD